MLSFPIIILGGLPVGCFLRANPKAADQDQQAHQETNPSMAYGGEHENKTQLVQVPLFKSAMDLIGVWIGVASMLLEICK